MRKQMSTKLEEEKTKRAESTPEPKESKVVDIMEALKASLPAAKKPAASAKTAEPAAEEARPARKRARG